MDDMDITDAFLHRDDMHCALSLQFNMNKTFSSLQICLIFWHSSPEDCWDRLQPPRDPADGLSGRKWMDGWILAFMFFIGNIM